MPSINFYLDNVSHSAGDEDSILDVSLRHDIEHAHACGSAARCSTCRVEVLRAEETLEPRNAAEARLAERLHLPGYVRLACQTRIKQDTCMRRLVVTKGELEHILSLEGKDRLKQLGSLQKISILFADIRGFTTLSERSLPYDVVHGLNYYFYHVGEVISRNHGTINNYMGDGIMALFGMDSEESGADHAVKAALEMVEVVERLDAQFETIFGEPIRIGVGVHCGEAVVGYIGSADSGAITVIGDAVNTASRIEGATKQVGVPVLVSQAVVHDLGDRLELGAKDSISLKGKSGRYDVYEVKSVMVDHEH